MLTLEKIKKIALEKHGKTLTDEQAAALLEKQGKLSDDELDNVAGGCEDQKEMELNDPCPDCGKNLYYTQYVGARFGRFFCKNCGFSKESLYV